MKYKTKLVEVEAIIVQPQYRNLEEIIKFVGEENLCPIERRPDYVLKIKTLEGDMAVSYGDYIVRGLKGEYYPCKPDIFRMKYEMTDSDKELIKHMVDRFLGWQLPKDFNPDAGISFTPSNGMTREEAYEKVGWWPVGTNLFDAMQAEEMIKYMLEGAPIK